MNPDKSGSLHTLTQHSFSYPESEELNSALFSTRALQLFEHQFAHNIPYQRYCSLKKASPSTVTRWQDIPMLSTDVFKLTPNPSCLRPEDQHTHFLTSGTTNDTRGIHYFRTTETYEASILAAWKHHQLPSIHPDTWILTPSPDEAPHSSLCHMFATLRDHYNPTARFALNDDQFTPELIPSLQNTFTPVTLLGTALSILRLIDELPTPTALPKGSWILETGGYKGTDKQLTKPELYSLIHQQLGIPPTSVWNEYSMTEISSQCYTSGTNSPHTSPPWMKIRVIDPETSLPVAAGELGYLCLYDLANVDSLLAIRTQDLAIYHDDHTFTLIGRDPSALPRGCSRTIH